MTVATRQQAQLWQNSETLMGHMLAVSPDNPIAHHQLAIVHIEAGRTDEAERHFREAIKIVPTFWEAQLALGTLLFNSGRMEEGAEHLDLALTHNPRKGMLARNTIRRRSLACTAILQLAQAGKPDRAIEHFSFLLAYAPAVLQSPDALSPILLDDGELGEHARAVIHARILQEPGLRGARLALAEAMYSQGDARRAVAHYDIALDQQRDLLILNNLAWILATDSDPNVRDPDRAVRLAEEAVALGGDANPGLLDTLAIAYDRAGRAEAASATRQRAARIASQRTGS